MSSIVAKTTESGDADVAEWKSDNSLPSALIVEKATRRLQVVRDEIDSLGALSVSRELFLDRLCEVVSEKLAELDLKIVEAIPRCTMIGWQN